ncbi:MAG: hypothetical protein WC665_09730 [Sulfurimonas sp.]
MKQYVMAFNKHFDSIEFLKNTKLIKKNPALNENFTHKKDIDILKIMNSKTSQNQALMLNFINSFTKSLEEQNLQFVFTTQTINTAYRHAKDTNIEKNIIIQKDILNSFHRSEGKHYQFFKKNIKIDAASGKKSERREFIRALEFHKDFNLHEHTIKAFDNSLNHLISYIGLYDHNRKSHNKGIGRCEIVVNASYEADIIQHFQLIKYTDKDTTFYYNENLFQGKLKEGNQLCIKFFQNDEENSSAIQIAKYLVSYMNADMSKNKGSHKFIFNNLNIRNITHSQVLFSKSLFSKIYKHINKYKALHKYKDMHEFTKAYNDHKIIIEFQYKNSSFANGALEDNLININQRFNERINQYVGLINMLLATLKKFKWSNVSVHLSLKDYQSQFEKFNEFCKKPNIKKAKREAERVKSHYNRFIKRHSTYFKKMTHSIEIEFVSERTTLKVDLSTYTSTSSFIYNKLKSIDADIQLIDKELRSYEYIKANNFYEEQDNRYANMRLNTLDDYVEQDIMLENLENNQLEKSSRMNQLIEIVDAKIIQYKEVDNQYVKYNTEKLSYALMAYEDRTFQFRESQENVKKFKDF